MASGREDGETVTGSETGIGWLQVEDGETVT